MTGEELARFRPHWLAASLCAGVAAANLGRASWAAAALAGALALGAVVVQGFTRFAIVVLALAFAGWWWGSARLDALDGSVLRAEAGRAGTLLVVITGPARRGRFETRLPARVQRFGDRRLTESVLLELSASRAPPQGTVLEVLGRIELPRGPEHGFDERVYLRRHGVHVVVRADRWRPVGRRGGVGGLADRLRARLARSLARGLRGERRALVEGAVLGDDEGLSDGLRQRFRASGLYHLLAVSGQNVAIVAGAVLLLAWLAGLARWLGELGALAAIGCYVLAVGAQPSVVRAGIAGALGSLAWLAARPRDRWYFLLVGALALLAWNPYVLLDAGFQLSFSAVAAIFLLAPRIQRALEGYPVPRPLAVVVSVSAACGLVTAPVLWLQFHAIPVLSVPANALAAPAVLPLLSLALAAAAVDPFWPGGAAALGWLNGWCAAYLAGCARLIGSLPFAQARTGWAAAGLATCTLATAAYAWRRWSRRS